MNFTGNEGKQIVEGSYDAAGEHSGSAKIEKLDCE